MKITQRFTTNRDDSDEVYGEYPFVVYKSLFITKNHLAKFCKLGTSINNNLRLSQEERQRIDYLEQLIFNKLHLTTVITIDN